MGQVTVRVTQSGAGLKFMTSRLKALPAAKAGDVIDIMDGAYAQSCIEDGYVEPFGGKMESDLEIKAGSTAVPVEPEPAAADFTAIKGIGKATAAALVEAGVRTYADLVAADAEKLAAAIGSNVTKVNEWQDAARLQESE